jgi:hypothetical protein
MLASARAILDIWKSIEDISSYCINYMSTTTIVSNKNWWNRKNLSS